MSLSSAYVFNPETVAPPPNGLIPYVQRVGKGYHEDVAAFCYLGAEVVFDRRNRRLTSRERLTAAYAIIGMDNSTIGLELGVAEDTVKSRLKKIYSTLGTPSRAALLRHMIDGANPVVSVSRPSEMILDERLSAREIEVAEAVSYGSSNPEIGQQLAISDRTVQTHLERIHTRTYTDNRVQLAAAFLLQPTH